MFVKIADFLREVKQELKKVAWPTRRETVRFTLLVVFISLGVAFFLGLGDFLFIWLFNKYLI